MTRRLAASILLLAILFACGDSSSSSTPAQDLCRLPTPQGEIDLSLVPKGFIADGEKEFTQTEKRRGRLVAVLIMDGTIQSVLDAYRELVKGSDFDVLQEDNEGFEAELYLQKGRGDLAVVQIRETGCENQTLVLLNLPIAD
jgi:hypothetical protein